MSFMLMLISFLAMGQHYSKGQKRLENNEPITLWPNCTVNYMFARAPEWPILFLQRISKIMNFIEDKTYVRFVATSYEPARPFVFLYNSSYPHILDERRWATPTLERHNEKIGIKEQSEYALFRVILQILGFLEEVNRSDRDEFVSIVPSLMMDTPECKEYFTKYTNYPPVVLPLNFRTIMYRGPKHCAKNGNDVLIYRDRTQKKALKRWEKHSDHVSAFEYENEWRRIEAFYPYEKCSASTYE